MFQDEGAAKIHRGNYRDHASAMRAYQQSGKHSTFRINAVDDTPEEDKSEDNVAAAMAQPKFCRYCKKKGHVISECRKKINKNNTSYKNSKPTQKPEQNKHKPTDPAMQQILE